MNKWLYLPPVMLVACYACYKIGEAWVVKEPGGAGMVSSLVVFCWLLIFLVGGIGFVIL